MPLRQALALLSPLAFAVQTATPACAEPVRAFADPLACMTAAIYYEAAREPDAGQQAVARVVLNRVADPAYPKSVCAVIFQGSERRSGCQFTFTCDGALRNTPDAALWERAGTAAAAALAAPKGLPSLLATNYHAAYVRPLWAATMHREAQIGRHIFYTRGANAGMPPILARLPGAPIPEAATFSAWGLKIARIAPASGGSVAVSGLAAGG